MTKSELIEKIANRTQQLPVRDIEEAVKLILGQMINTLEDKERIEIRGFGSFSVRRRAAREGRNPKTGALVQLAERYATHFKPGKELRERVNYSEESN